MKRNFRWISIQLNLFFFTLLILINYSYSQQLWGTCSDGGGKKTGGNIFSINADGTGFTEQYQFFNDGEHPESQRLLAYGDGYMYGVAGEILYKLLPDGSNYQAVYVFQTSTGATPKTRLVKGLDGWLYGTTQAGGSNNDGVIYKVQKDGTGYQVLHHFNGTDGEYPLGNLLQFNNGLLCGTTYQGGSSDMGVVYRINPDGTGFQVLHSFNGTNGKYPDGGVMALTVSGTTYVYGVTTYGGNNDFGVIYRVEPDGTNFSRQYNFSSTSGKYPRGPMIKIGNILYGVTQMGGNNEGGVVFAYDADADSYQKLRQFTSSINNTVEQAPTGPLLNLNGVLYGTTELGGSFSKGSLYKINTDGTGYQVIHEFEDDNGYYGNLMSFNNQIYGMTKGGYSAITFTGGTSYRLNPDGSSFQTIHVFGDTAGIQPTGSLIRAQDGNLYGLTTYGGSGYSNGVAFRIEPNGTNYTVLQWLSNGPAYGQPMGALMQASNGSFYGMNNVGGTAYSGQLFKLTVGSSITYDTYNTFCLAPDCSQFPVGSLIQASDGNLYGMTPTTGQNTGQGNIFRVNTSGSGYTLIKKFNGVNAANPAGSLIQAPDGFLYGMTENGGLNGFGVIFKIRMDGTGFQIIYEFGQNANALYGAHPKGSLLMGSDGKLYGMTYAGGTGWAGTVFRISPSGGAFSVLYNFNGTNGAFPVASLIEDVSSGYLFGMTEQGGTSNYGTIFKIRKDGTNFQKLKDFNGTNGKYPKGDLLIVPTVPIPQKSPLDVVSELNPIKSIYNFTISPNPAQYSLNIQFQKPVTGKITYSVMDMQGRKLIHQTNEERSTITKKTIDISDLPSGTYILELSTLKEKITQKVVKQ